MEAPEAGGEQQNRKPAFSLLEEMLKEFFQKHKISLSLEVSCIHNLEQSDLF